MKIIKRFHIKWIALVLAALLGIFLMTFDPDSRSLQSGNAAEEKIRTLCERVRGAGEVTVAVTLDGESVCGVGIVCEGGDDPEVVKRLVSLVSASCDVPTNRIYVTGAEKDLSDRS